MKGRVAAWLARRARRRRLGRFTPPPGPPRAALTDIVYDATLMSLAAVRLAAKNLIIIRTLRDGLDYDDAFYLAAIRQELLVEAAERDRDAQRIMESLDAIAARPGRPEHPTDYRAIDLDTMRRRIAASTALAIRLREIAAEPHAIAEVFDAARAGALDEIAADIERTTRFQERSPLTPEERSDALDHLASHIRRSLADTQDPTAG